MIKFDNRFYIPTRGTVHLGFRWEGRNFVYCYIRKNACSTMKRVIFAANGTKEIEPFPFRQFAVPIKPWRRYDNAFFIYRDPIERIVSLFVSKLVQRDRHADIAKNYERLVGSLDAATFDTFVLTYLSKTGIDPHCVPQSAHLASIRYEHAIRIDRLGETMIGLMGRSAEPFFAEHQGATSTNRYDEPAHSLPSSALHQRFIQTGAVPSMKALLTPATRSKLLTLYRADTRMIERIER